MKITYVYQYFGTPRGSWSTRVYEFCKRWVQAGHEVTVITAPYEKSDIKANGFISNTNIEGINVIVINLADSNRSSIILRAWRAILFAIVSTYFTLRKNSDVSIFSSGPITTGFPAIVWRRLRGKCTVFEVRDLWPGGGIEMGKIKGKLLIQISQWFERLCYQNSNLIIAASQGQGANIISRFPNTRVEIIPNSSDNDLFSKKTNTTTEIDELTKGKNMFLHIGSLGFIHNVKFLLQVAMVLKANFPSHKIIMVFIGEGAERTQLEKFSKENQLDNVIFTGIKPKLELVPWLQACVATLFTTLDNPVQDTCSPNKVFDSFAAGKPVIQTTRGWIKDLFDKTQCGINIAPNDALAFANAMVDLAANKSKADSMGQNAKQLALTDFNRDLLADKYLRLLLDCLRK